MVSDESLDGRSTYPCAGTLPCRILSRTTDPSGRDLAHVAIDILVEADEDLLVDIFANDVVDLDD